MSSSADRAVEILQQQLGLEEPPSGWFVVDQTIIDRYADATLDHYFLHTDPQACAEQSPYGTTIAHGFLTLSLLSHLARQIPEPEPNPFQGVTLRVNYGLDRVRFISPVTVNSRIRARRKLISVRRKDEAAVHLSYEVTVETEGLKKPACVAQWLIRLVYE